jgi:hypothetical protein
MRSVTNYLCSVSLSLACYYSINIRSAICSTMRQVCRYKLCLPEYRTIFSFTSQHSTPAIMCSLIGMEKVLAGGVGGPYVGPSVSQVDEMVMHTPRLSSWTLARCPGTSPVLISLSVSLSHPWPIETRRMIICGERDYNKSRHGSVLPREKAYMSLNGEYGPDMRKRKDEWVIPGCHDDETNA